jgi:Fe-S cluster biogenesis protein NfuA
MTPTLNEVGEVEVLVYFTNTTRYAQGIQPFETPVLRRLPASAFRPQALLEEYFRGPTQSEQALDLQAITSGFTGVRSVELVDGYAHVYLEGACQSSGATYTIAQPILRNLAQFPEIEFVKIYDGNGDTGDPESKGHSIPICLEP